MKDLQRKNKELEGFIRDLKVMFHCNESNEIARVLEVLREDQFFGRMLKLDQL